MLEGACHCGNLSWTLHTAVADADITARACDCSFCRLHGARTWSDPEGAAEIAVHDPDALQRYAFGSHSTEFLICRNCGAYAVARVSEGDAAWVTLNLRLTGREWPETAVHYGPEDRETRRDRRKELWTPVRRMKAGGTQT